MLVAGEYGKVLRINAGVDLGASTARQLTVTRPDGSSFTRDQTDISVGTTPVTVEVEDDDGSVVSRTFAANEYVQYTLQSGDITLGGRYRLKLQVDFGAGQRLLTVNKVLRVED